MESKLKNPQEELKLKWKKASEASSGINLTGRSMRQILRLWLRCEGRCHICGGLVPNPLYQWEFLTRNNYPSRDHIIPKSKGGNGRRENILLAHNRCNRLRGNVNLEEVVGVPERVVC